MSDQEFIHYSVPEGVEDVRADKILAAHFTDFSRTQIQEAFKAGLVLVQGSPIKKHTPLSKGQEIKLQLIKPDEPEVRPVDIPLEVLYEDDDIIAVNKPAGMVTHPGNGTGEDTLVHAMLHLTNGKLSHLGGKERPGVVHRLDKDTTGVILFAKTDKSYLALTQMFADRQIDKQYLALVTGSFELDSGTIQEPIERCRQNRLKMKVSRTGRPAHTDWEVEERLGTAATLLRCYLHTGRTHQIRVHLAHIRHPILGDTTYGYQFGQLHIKQPPRVLLHATSLSFNHPISTQPISIKRSTPEDMLHQIQLIT